MAPKIHRYPEKVFYQFNNMLMTTVDMGNGLNRAIVIVKIVGNEKLPMTYSIYWIVNKPIKKLT